MSQEKINILLRALKREKSARKIAEKILDDKSKSLYIISDKLKKTNLQLEHLLDEKSSQLQGVFENINDAYLVTDVNGNVLKMNDVAVDVFNYDIHIEKFNLSNLIYYKDKEHAHNSFNLLKSKGELTNFITRIITKKSEVKWVQVNATVIFDKLNKPIAAQGIFRDITSRKADEDLVIESENRLSSLILNLQSAVLLEDENNKIVLTNTKFCKLFKIPFSPELLKGQDCSEAAENSKNLFKDSDFFLNRVKELLNNRQQVLGDELTMTDGVILERDFIPILIGNEYKGHLWTYRDITFRKQYSKILESQKEKYSSIIANMNLGLLEVNNDDKVLMINQSFSDMSGYTENELLGKKASHIFLSKNDSSIIEEQTKNRIKRRSSSYELKIKNKQGVHKTWLVSGAPNYNLNGDFVGSIGIHLDITELKSLQQQKERMLKELEKSNDELQEYAHIVSHDLKTPLRSIYALVSWIKSDNENKFDEITTQNLELIELTLEKMEQLITNVLEYSSAGSKTEEVTKIDLNTIFDDLKIILYIPKNTSVNIVKKLPIIKGHKTKFKQLFLNLISNSIKYSNKEKNIIEIDFIEKKKFYQFSIKDNGIGIHKEFHENIFKIFHTLDKNKDSSGIGLSIVKKIVNLYNGKVWLESKPGIGTTFFFTIKK